MIGPMPLWQVVRDLDSLNEDLTMFRETEGDLSADSSVYLVNLDVEDEPDNLRGLVAVWHVREMIQGKIMLAGLVDPDVPTKVNLLLEHLEYDA